MGDKELGVDEVSFRMLVSDPEDDYFLDATLLRRLPQWLAQDSGHPPLAPPGRLPVTMNIDGIDWAKLEKDSDLKSRVMDRIRSFMAQRAKVNVKDVRSRLKAKLG